MDSRNTFSYRKITLATALAAAAIAAQPALAEEYETLDAVSVTAEALKIDVSTQETPQTVNVVSSKTIAEGNIRKMNDALRYTPGVFNSYGADYDTDWFVVRGFEATTLVNGQRQYKDGFFDSTAEPFGLETIEVLQGPASSLYGDSMPGGVVNLVTKKPTKTPQHSLSVAGGSNKFVQAGLDFADNATEDGSKRYRIVAMVNREDSFIHDTEKHRVYFAPSFTIDVSEKTSLTLLASYVKDGGVANGAFFPAYGTLLPRDGKYVDPHTSYGLPGDDYDKEQVNFGWEFSHAFNENLKYKQSVNFSYTDLYLRTSSLWSGYNSLTGDMAVSTLINDGTVKGFTFDNNLTYTKETESFNNTFQLGFDYQWFENNWLANGSSGIGTPVVNVNPFNPSISTPAAGASSALDLYSWNRNKKQLGIYGQVQTIYRDSLLLKAGARWDKVNVGADSDNPATNVLVNSLDETHFSWNAGIMLLNDYGISPYINYSEAFFATGSLAFVSGTNAAGVAVSGYALPDPTETKQFEYGIKFTPNWLDGFINVAFFDLKQKNYMTTAIAGDGALLTAPVPEMEANGIEVQARLSPVKNLTVDLNYMYIDKIKADQRVAQSPKHLATAWVGYDFSGVGAFGLTAGVGVRYNGSSIGTFPSVRVPDATVWDLAIGYAFDKHWHIQGTVTNVFDKEYVQSSDYGFAYLGEGRVARATLTYNW